MKRIISQSIFTSLLLATFVASPAMANSLSLKGYGFWRATDNGEGQYTAVRNILWSDCLRRCLNSKNCTGVEYGMRSDGTSFCELHTDKLGTIDNTLTGNAGVVWVKTP